MNARAVGAGGGPRPPEDRGADRGFREALDRARRPGRQAPRRPDAPLPGELPTAPRATLERRRAAADVKDEWLSEARRDLDGRARAEDDRQQATAPAPAPRPADAPAPATLAAAVERLALELRRRQAAEGPSLELRFGATLHVRVTQAGKAIRIQMTAGRGAARLARAELPGIVAALRARGLAVARAEVRDLRLADAASPAAEDGALTAAEGFGKRLR